MRSYTFIPDNVRESDSLTIPKVLIINGWQNYDDILSKLKSLNGNIFSVWQHPAGTKIAEGIFENQPATLLTHCTYVGELTNAMQALRFSPDLNCPDELLTHIKNLKIAQAPAKEASLDIFKMFHDRLFVATNAELLRACQVSTAFEVTTNSLCQVKYPDSIAQSVDLLLLEDGRNFTIWQRLRELASASLNTITAFALEQQADGLVLHKVILTPNEKFKKDVQTEHHDAITRAQDQTYISSQLNDLFGPKIDGSTDTCKKNLGIIYDIVIEPSINIDTQLSPQQIAETVVAELKKLAQQRIEQATNAVLKLEEQQEAANLALAPNMDDDRELEMTIIKSLQDQAISSDDESIDEAELERRAILLSKTLNTNSDENNNNADSESEAPQQAIQESTRTAHKENCEGLLKLLQDSKWELIRLQRPALIKDCIKYLKTSLRAETLPDDAEILTALKNMARNYSDTRPHSILCSVYKEPESTRKFIDMLNNADRVQGLYSAMQNDRPAPPKRKICKY